jgi:hypothetical protein
MFYFAITAVIIMLVILAYALQWKPSIQSVAISYGWQPEIKKIKLGPNTPIDLSGISPVIATIIKNSGNILETISRTCYNYQIFFDSVNSVSIDRIIFKMPGDPRSEMTFLSLTPVKPLSDYITLALGAFHYQILQVDQRLVLIDGNNVTDEDRMNITWMRMNLVQDVNTFEQIYTFILNMIHTINGSYPPLKADDDASVAIGYASPELTTQLSAAYAVFFAKAHAQNQLDVAAAADYTNTNCFVMQPVNTFLSKYGISAPAAFSVVAQKMRAVRTSMTAIYLEIWKRANLCLQLLIELQKDGPTHWSAKILSYYPSVSGVISSMGSMSYWYIHCDAIENLIRCLAVNFNQVITDSAGATKFRTDAKNAIEPFSQPASASSSAKCLAVTAPITTYLTALAQETGNTAYNNFAQAVEPISATTIQLAKTCMTQIAAVVV